MAEFFGNLGSYILGFFKQLIMSFADIRPSDILDIVIVAYIIYKAIGFFKETRAKILLKGLLFLFVFWLIAQWFDLISIRWLLVKFFDYAIVAVAIIFQPELRHALERVGHSGFTKFGAGGDSAVSRAEAECIDKVCKACASMQEQKIGALIAFERSTPLGEIIATGTEIDANVSEELVSNVFYPKSPLHDGGMVIRSRRIAAAGCILPLTANTGLNKSLGTRHRAAVGLSESSDAVVVVVSEETGIVSVCINGIISRNYNQISLREKLYAELIKTEDNRADIWQKVKTLFESVLPSKKKAPKTDEAKSEEESEEKS
ncbi:MAG: diadenylate cyclase CdaA [Clostridia bacterium]|nr:diadenylate cyclase CdaA [Clostridia bacterium]